MENNINVVEIGNNDNGDNNIKIRKVFLDDLPRWGKQGKGNEGTINWKESIGRRVKFVCDNVEGEVEIVNYEGKYLWIKYLDKEPFKIGRGNFQKCCLGKLLGIITGEFKIEIGTTFKVDKRDLTIIDREYRESDKDYNLKYYKHKCNICGWSDDKSWIIEYDLLQGNGCSCCAGRTVIEGINDIPTTAPWMVKYFQGGYDEAKQFTKSSDKKICPICPDCGRVKNNPMSISTIYKNKSTGCSCSDGLSFGHKYIHNLLEKLQLDFISNHKFNWCKFFNIYKNKEVAGEYDFVIEDMKIIVEIDGGWHRQDNNRSGQSKEESKFLDDEKDRLAKENGYKVIRIIYDDDLIMKKSILESEMVDYFDLSNINWLECEEYALRNLVKKACEIKRDNPNMTTTEIGLKLGLDRTTIIKYLKKGSDIWDWIDYDTKEEMKKSGSRNGKMHGKPVEIFNKEGVSLGVFESCAELERQSEGLFGIKILREKVSEVCKGKRNHSKGFTFKYID